MLGQVQQGVSVLLSDFFLSIYNLLGVKRKLLTSRTCIQIFIQCIHDAELVMTQKLETPPLIIEASTILMTHGEKALSHACHASRLFACTSHLCSGAGVTATIQVPCRLPHLSHCLKICWQLRRHLFLASPSEPLLVFRR